MSLITYHLSLDLKQDYHQVLVMKAGDAGSRQVEITITDNGQKFQLTDDYFITVRWQKPDHTIVENPCEKLDSSTVRFICSEQMLLVPGTARAELYLNDADGTLLSTMSFHISLKPASVTTSEIESSDEFNSLITMMKEFKEEHNAVMETVSDYKAEALTARTEAESYAVGGTGTRENEDADNASYYCSEAQTAAGNAKTSAGNAKQSETNAEQYQMSAGNFASAAESFSHEAERQEALASGHASDAEEHAASAESYAVGGTGTRENEDTNNAKYYYEQSRTISESFSGALRPMGTVAFASLPALSDTAEGTMYNLSDSFTTTDDFKEGSGHAIPAGANIYKTADGKWDVLAGTPVTGVKGNAESSYRKGNVNITAADVGALPVNGNAVSATMLKSHGIKSTGFDWNTLQPGINDISSGSGFTQELHGPVGAYGWGVAITNSGRNFSTIIDDNEVSMSQIYHTHQNQLFTRARYGTANSWSGWNALLSSRNYMNYITPDNIGALKKTIIYSSDFDELMGTGIYIINSTGNANSPVDAIGILLVQTPGSSGGEERQIFFVHDGVSACVYMRVHQYMASSGRVEWLPWDKISAGSADTATKAVKDGNGNVITDTYTKKSDLLNLIYPVGSIYMSVNSTNPAALFGGTWVAWGSGRVPMGIDTGVSYANYVERLGGNASYSYTPSGTIGAHALTVNEIPSHGHSVSVTSSGSCTISSSGNHTHSIKANVTGASGTARAIPGREGENTYAAIDSSGAHTHTVPNHTHTISQKNVGGGAGHNHTFSGSTAEISTLQPYIVCYMWKRTA